MALKYQLTLLVGCVCLASLVAGQSTSAPAIVPDELRLNPNQPTDDVNLDSNNGQQQQQQQVLPNNKQQQLDNQVPRLPTTSTTTSFSTNVIEDQDDQSDEQQQNGQQNERFDPFGLFQPRPRPNQQDGNQRRPSIFDLFGGGMFEPFRRQQEMMDQQFSQLERQAGEGQEVSYFSRNGVSYMRTCTTKRVI